MGFKYKYLFELPPVPNPQSLAPRPSDDGCPIACIAKARKDADEKRRSVWILVVLALALAGTQVASSQLPPTGGVKPPLHQSASFKYNIQVVFLDFAIRFF
jgi:hypothetical protein